MRLLEISSRKLVGYKVMATDGNNALSGADSRQGFELKKGKVISMSGNGIYLAPTEEYVIDYYSGLAEDEVLLKLEYLESDITSGDINDAEPEISARVAKILDYKFI